MRKIVITFRGENEDQIATSLTNEIGMYLEETGLESSLVSEKHVDRQLQVASFMTDKRRMEKAAKRLERRRAKYGRKRA